MGRVGSSSPTHGQQAWTRPQTTVPVPGTGADTVGAPPAGQWGHPANPSPRLPNSQAALGPWAEGMAGREGPGLDGGKDYHIKEMHFLVTQSSRILSLLASWMPLAFSLPWSPPPNTSPVLMQHTVP